MQNQHNSAKKFPLALLLKSAFSVMLKNYDKILFLFIIFALIHSFSFFINDLFFVGAENVNHDLLSYKIKFFSFNILIFYCSYVVSFALIKLIDGNRNIGESLFYIFKKTVPLLVTYLMVSGLFIIAAGEIYVATTITDIADIAKNAKSFFHFIIFIIAIFAAVTSIKFFWFCSYIAILEEKYYFAAMKQSFSDSKGHVLEILWKNIAIAFVILLPFTIASVALTQNPPSFGSSGSLKTEILNDIIFYLPQQFLVIVNYLLYKFYKSHLPKQHAVQKQDKATLLLIVLLPIVLIALVVVTAS